MGSITTMIADVLVAVLLVATIATSVRLSRRFALLKADEASMRIVVGELSVATASAERAILGLRSTLDACDGALVARVAEAERCREELGRAVEAAARPSAELRLAAEPRPTSVEPPAMAIPTARPVPADPLEAAISSAREIAARAQRRIQSRAA